MRKSVLIATLAFAFTAGAETPNEQSHPPCDFSASAKGAFSSSAASDTISATVRGSPCWSGRFQIVVRGSDGRVLYEYDEPFKQHTAVHWEDDAALLEAARELVDETVGKAFSRTSADLPPLLPPAELYEEHYTEVLVPAEQYRTIREQRVPALFHSTHYEGWRWVVYDPAAKRALIVAAGGL
jgi:hypothetical protein